MNRPVGRAHILIVTSSHLCRNPRVVKEASTLGAAGYAVTVLTVFTHPAFAAQDRELVRDLPFRLEVLDLAAARRGASFAQRAATRAARWCLRVAGLETAQTLGPASALRRRAHALARSADLVIAHTEIPLWSAVSLLRAGHRVAVDLEDWYSEDLLPADRRYRPLALLRRAEACALRRAAYVSTTSASLAAALAARYNGCPPIILHNTFPLASASRTSQPPTVAPPRLVWFSQTVGPGRGLEQFLAAWATTRQPSRVVLLGSVAPDYREQLLALVPSSRRSAVEFLPPVPPGDLPAKLAEFDLGLALEAQSPPSRDLTITNKLLQYLNAGLAVVATDTAGQREVLQAAPGCGLLIDPDQPAQVAAQLDELLADPARLSRMQHAARAAAEREFSWEHDAPRLLAAVARALASPPTVAAADEDHRRTDHGPRILQTEAPSSVLPQSALPPLPTSALRTPPSALRNSSAPRLLIVSPHFPPVNAPDMQRVRLSLPHFVAAGWAVTVLTVDDPTPTAPLEPALLATVPPEVRVVRARCLSRRWTRWLGVGNVALRALPFLFLAGGRELRGGRGDLVYFSTTMFIVLPFGRVWRAWFGVPYVIDLQDPWLSDHYEGPGAPPPPGGWKYRIAHATARALEGWTLRRCAHVISVSGDYLATLGRRYRHFPLERGTVVPFGAPESDLARARELGRGAPPLLPAAPHRRIAYAGRLGADMVPALELLFAAAARSRADRHPVDLHFFGTSYAPAEHARPTATTIAARHDLGALVHEHPARVGYLEALRLLLESDLGLVLGSTDPAYAPSKLFTTLLAGHPVLVLAPAGGVLARTAATLAGVALVTFDPAAPLAPGPVAALAALLAAPADRAPWPAGAMAPPLPAAGSSAEGARQQLAVFARVLPPPGAVV